MIPQTPQQSSDNSSQGMPIIGMIPPGGNTTPPARTSAMPPLNAQATLQQPEQSYSTNLPVVLVVLDGYGIAPPSRGNAIAQANTPVMDQLMRDYPTMALHASGEVVGLPWSEMGNSEVGHINMGSGKIIYQNLPLINKAISDGSFFQNSVFLNAFASLKEKKSKLHLMGLVSNGGIHSNRDHLYALLEMCQKQQVTENVYIHAMLDGRDTERNAALSFIAALETKMQSYGFGKIATLSGRFYAMDRDNRWDRTEAAYNAMRFGKSAHMSDSPLKAIEQAYAQELYDEEFPPTVITQEDGITPIATIDDGDVIIFFNFRADRARQLTKAFVLPAFQKFDRGEQLQNSTFVSMTEYEKNLPLSVAFSPDIVRSPVAKVVSDVGWKQLHIAETEKYAHVTFFFNGGAEDAFMNEDRVLIPSPRVKTYDEIPEMAVMQIAERMVTAIQSKKYQFIVANFANVDMVGHTGNLQATIQAVEAVDTAVGIVASAVEAVNGTLVVTADHGNAEEMINLQTGEMIKEHTTNPVPCIIANSILKEQRNGWPQILDGDLSRIQPVGVLSDVAPTVLHLMGLNIPPDMTSRNLL